MNDERQEKFESWWNENVNVYKVYRFEWMCYNQNGAFNVYSCLRDLISFTSNGKATYFTDVDNIVHVFNEDYARDCKFTFYEVKE